VLTGRLFHWIENKVLEGSGFSSGKKVSGIKLGDPGSPEGETYQRWNASCRRLPIALFYLYLISQKKKQDGIFK
jgi:hypothetical protein